MAKHKKHDEEHMSEAWLIPYADVLTLLLALFIVLFASSQSDQAKFTAMAQSFTVIFSGSASIFDGGGGGDSAVPLEVTSPPQPSTANGQEGQAGEDMAAKDGQSEAGQDALAEAMEKAMQQAAQQATMAEMAELASEVEDYVEEQGLGAQLSVTNEGEGVKITITEKATFDSGSAGIKPEFRGVITNIANIIKQHQGVTVEVGGYTDNRPIHTSQFSDNWDLSAARALTFMKLLIADSGMDPASFTPIGYGEYHPIANNDDIAGREMNRRVEVSIRGNAANAIVIPVQ